MNVADGMDHVDDHVDDSGAASWRKTKMVTRLARMIFGDNSETRPLISMCHSVLEQGWSEGWHGHGHEAGDNLIVEEVFLGRTEKPFCVDLCTHFEADTRKLKLELVSCAFSTSQNGALIQKLATLELKWPSANTSRERTDHLQKSPYKLQLQNHIL